jgi:hypothetical protein
MKNKTHTGSIGKTLEQKLQSASLIKLGVDAHADHYRVVRQVPTPVEASQSAARRVRGLCYDEC